MNATPPPLPGGRKASNVFGVVAVAAGAAILLWELVRVIIQTAMYARGDFYGSVPLGVAGSLIVAALAIVAIVFGIIGLVAKNRPRVLAAIGLGVGIATLFGVLLWSVLHPLVLAILTGF